MAASIPLADPPTRDDLRIFLERLLRAGHPEVRLVARDAAVAVFGCTQSPRGITDQVPVVLVMRAFALAEPIGRPVDTTVEARALLDRIARLDAGGAPAGLPLDLPDVTASAAWAGVLPPVSGWQAAGALDAPSLAAVAADGMARVAARLPADPGEAVVHRVRSSVWGTEVAPGIPAAAAFAAEAMGFLRGEERLRIARSLTWIRLTASRGHVLVRSLLG